MLLWFHCKRSGLKREVFVGETIIKSGNQNKTDLICELLGVQKQHLGAKYLSQLNVEQIQQKPSPIAFVQMPDYDNEAKNELCEYLVNVFMLMIGEGKDILSDWESESSDNDKHQNDNNLGSKIFGKTSDDIDD